MSALLLLAAIGLYDCLRLPDDLTVAPQLYAVVGEGRLPFYRFSDCGDAPCGEGAYVVPGDRVIVFKQRDGCACALFVGRSATFGWLDDDRLTRDPAADRPAVSAWVGDWDDRDDHIRLAPGPAGTLTVKGDAWYPSRDADQPNIGELDGSAIVGGNRAEYAAGTKPQDTCQVTMRLFGDVMLVIDNEQCGGQNVRFRGVYRRRSSIR